MPRLERAPKPAIARRENVQEIEFIGSLGMPPTRYDEIFPMVSTGELEPEAVVSETIGLKGVSDKLEAMTDFETVGIPGHR